jgi:hypothetical protein
MRFQITSFLFFINLCPSLSLINFVLIGSTGDLAKKYLWEALFVQYIEVPVPFSPCLSTLTVPLSHLELL